jgi:alpha-L-fucosidase
MQQHDGKLEAVLLGKLLTEEERKCLVWDIERGPANQIEPLPWQTDTCIGDWHYKIGVRYKTARNVILSLCDIVSKNGNLLLNIPVRSDGTIDNREEAVLKGIANWMDANKECIFDTRPWKVYGEGPASEGPVTEVKGMNENKLKPLTSADVRFTSKGDTLYAIVLGTPKQDIAIKALGTAAKLLDKPIGDLTLLGSTEKVQWSQTADALTINLPAKLPNDIAIVFKISL